MRTPVGTMILLSIGVVACGGPPAASEAIAPAAAAGAASTPPAEPEPAAPRAEAARPAELAEPPARLTRAQVERASAAAQARLPPVDPQAAQACVPMPMATPADLAARARCGAAAGQLGMAILLWKQLVTMHAKAPEAAEAFRELGPAYERAGYFNDAAEAHTKYARWLSADFRPSSAKTPSGVDAAAPWTRGICMYRQLGDLTAAQGQFQSLKASRRAETPADLDTLCRSVRPITL